MKESIFTLLSITFLLTSCSVTKLESPQQMGLKSNVVYKNYSSKYALRADNYNMFHKGLSSADSTNVNNP